VKMDAETRAVPCSGCGHTRGNHRWFAVAGKHECYATIETTGDKCECKAFIR
jgi:hypothetical protein